MLQIMDRKPILTYRRTMSRIQRATARGLLDGMSAAWGDVSLIERRRRQRPDSVTAAWDQVGKSMHQAMRQIDKQIQTSQGYSPTQ